MHGIQIGAEPVSAKPNHPTKTPIAITADQLSLGVLLVPIQMSPTRKRAPPTTKRMEPIHSLTIGRFSDLQVRTRKGKHKATTTLPRSERSRGAKYCPSLSCANLSRLFTGTPTAICLPPMHGGGLVSWRDGSSSGA